MSPEKARRTRTLRGRRLDLSPAALIVSMLALTLAVGGTSYAAGLSKNSVGTKQLKNQSARSS